MDKSCLNEENAVFDCFTADMAFALGTFSISMRKHIKLIYVLIFMPTAERSFISALIIVPLIRITGCAVSGIPSYTSHIQPNSCILNVRETKIC